jgi:hypothetical protein
MCLRTSMKERIVLIVEIAETVETVEIVDIVEIAVEIAMDTEEENTAMMIKNFKRYLF